MIPRHEQEMIWASKPMLRRVYERWYERIRKHTGDNPMEIGSEIRLPYKLGYNRVWSFTQEEFDAEDEAWLGANGPVNPQFFAIDVLHHIGAPKNAFRILAARGPETKMIWLEPDCASLLGRLVYSLHFEGLKHQRLASDWFLGRKFSSEEWRVVRVDRWCDLLHLVSGGWTGRQLLPDCASGPVEWIGSVLSWFPSLFSTRMMVVLERR